MEPLRCAADCTARYHGAAPHGAGPQPTDRIVRSVAAITMLQNMQRCILIIVHIVAQCAARQSEQFCFEARRCDLLGLQTPLQLPPLVACCVLHVACCTLRVARCVLHVACCTLRVACCVLHVACCTLRVARCVLHVACCTLRVARCVLHVACCVESERT